MMENRKSIFLLACVQASSMTGAGMVMLVTALAGAALSPVTYFSTLALALQFTMTMISTIPASFLMQRIGRKSGFIIGQITGIVGAIFAFIAIYNHIFWLFVLGGMCLGVHNAFWAYLRFAASDIVRKENRSKAISWVLAGGIVAAIAAAEIAKRVHDLIPMALYAGAYLMIGLLAVIAILLIYFVDFSEPKKLGQAKSARPLKIILSQPKAILAILSGAIGYSTMSLLMTATPLAMHDHGFDFKDSAFVIQWHALAMFAPSFITGHLIKYYGCKNIILLGAVMNLMCIISGLSGYGLGYFWVSLFLLGLGWNFTYIGGTTLMSECYFWNKYSIR